jgi:acyl-CoA thioesterase II
VREPAGDFEVDTAVEGTDGRYRATLSDSWELWGPAGGYVSAIALRAAGAHSRFDRPASYSCNYLGVADFAPIEVEVSTIREAKRSEVIRVSLIQRERPFLDATVWTIDEDMHGLEYDAAPMPEVPGPEGLVPWQDVVRPSEDLYGRFWSNVEERPIEQFTSWRDRVPGPPLRESWCRFRPKATFDDPYLDAARALLLIDTMGWPAVMMARSDPPQFVAPTIEVSARFHRPAASAEWLLSVASAPIASGGLIGSTAQVWGQSGTLVASGGQHMLCRPVPA